MRNKEDCPSYPQVLLVSRRQEGFMLLPSTRGFLVRRLLDYQVLYLPFLLRRDRLNTERAGTRCIPRILPKRMEALHPAGSCAKPASLRLFREVC